MDGSSGIADALGNVEVVGLADPSRYPLPQGEGKQQQGSPTQTDGKPAKELPVWQMVSGLTAQSEGTMSRSERRFAIRKLFREFERRAREALSEHEKDAEASERTYLWTPLESLCFELGIARRKLSSLTKELTGMSAQEVIDRVRAESLRERITATLKPKAEKNFAWLFEQEEKAYRKRSRAKVYPAWEIKGCNITPEQIEKEKQQARQLAEEGMRIEPKEGWAEAAGNLLRRVWNTRRADPALAWAEGSAFAARQAFARGLGFSSYQRLHRACLLSVGKSPMALEHEVMLACYEELVRENAPKREAVREEVLKG